MTKALVPTVKIMQVRRLLASGEAKRVREAAGLSLSEMAGGVPIDTSTLWKWETGRHSPRGQAALQYADLLDLVREATPSVARSDAG